MIHDTVTERGEAAATRFYVIIQNNADRTIIYPCL